MSTSDSGTPPPRPRKLVLRKISTPAPQASPVVPAVHPPPARALAARTGSQPPPAFTTEPSSAASQGGSLGQRPTYRNPVAPLLPPPHPTPERPPATYWAPPSHVPIPPPPSRISIAPMVASVAAGPLGTGGDSAGFAKRRNSVVISTGVALAGLLIAFGMALQARMGRPTSGVGQATAPSTTPVTASASVDLPTAAHAATSAHPGASTTNVNGMAHASAGGLVPTANVDDLPRAPPLRRFVPVGPAVRTNRPAAAPTIPAATQPNDTASDTDPPKPEDTAAVATAPPSKKDAPAESAAAPESATATPAPSSPPGAPSAEDPLLKAMRQAVDDQAHGSN